jgi:hypothetical protein
MSKLTFRGFWGQGADKIGEILEVEVEKRKAGLLANLGRWTTVNQRPFLQKSTLGSFVVKIWSRVSQNLGGMKPE